MPASTPAKSKTIKGTMPARVGTYAGSTVPQLHGKGSNKTAEFLAAIPAEHPGQQGFYREALNDIDHPLQAGTQINYGQLQNLLNGPQRAQALDAYARQNKLAAVSAEQMQAAAFAAAKQRLLERGAANPDAYAFPATADSALRAPLTQRGIAHGDFVQPGAGVAQNAPSLAQRYADLSTQQATMTAPGMSALPLAPTVAVAPPAASRRVIRGSGPLIAGN